MRKFLNGVGATNVTLLNGGDIYSDSTTNAAAFFAADSYLNGAYFNITGKDFSGYPGKASAEFIIGNSTGGAGVESVFKIVVQDYVGGFTDKVTVRGSDGLVTVTGRIAGVTDPTSAQDAATKNYVDTHGGSGTVTSVSVVSANGFAGSVATSTSTPAITVTTSITGVLKGNGTAISAATAGTDYTSPTGTETLTNKRVTPRINSTTSSATPSINTDTTDQYNITALAAAITSMTSGLSGTPTDGQKLLIRIKDNGTARALTWGTSFVSSGVATLLATTVASKTHLVGLIYDSVAAKWVCQAVDAVGY